MNQEHLTHAHQGHRYLLEGLPAIALNSGTEVRVLRFKAEEPWYGFIEEVQAHQLLPQPMKYFSGAVPV